MRVTALTCIAGKAGVEMEALIAASVACLPIYYMAKATYRSIIFYDIRLIENTSGKSGDYKAVERMTLMPITEALNT